MSVQAASRTTPIDRAVAALLAPTRRAGGSPLAVALLTVGTAALALAIVAGLVGLVGGSPGSVLSSMIDGSVGSASSISTTLMEATPLLLVAVGTCVASRAGVFNIGQEGQMLIGAALGAFVGLRTQGPPELVSTLALLCAALGGAAWAALAAVMRYRRGVDVVVSTLLLIFIAEQLVSFLVSRPSLLQETRIPGQIVAQQSDALAPAYRLPALGEHPGLTVGVGTFIALGLAVVMAGLLARSRWGFRIRMLGHNPLAARHAGVREAAYGTVALAISGAFAGLAGGVVLTGQVYRLQPGMSDNYGWDGLLVALVARDRPLAAVVTALAFGGLRAGGGLLASTGVPAYLVDITQALLVIAFVLPPALLALWHAHASRRRGRAAAAASARAAASGAAA
ncbi:MAG: ABC transporter permease [Frankia sp.]|nr:ABC transporter permease [Frankia sp.]